MLYQAIVNAIESSANMPGRREEPAGLHFVDQGEVLVVDEQYTPYMRMTKSDAFGMCDVLKKVGPEFMGDIRAGIR